MHAVPSGVDEWEYFYAFIGIRLVDGQLVTHVGSSHPWVAAPVAWIAARIELTPIFAASEAGDGGGGDIDVWTKLIKPRGPCRTAEQVEIATHEYVDWLSRRRLD